MNGERFINESLDRFALSAAVMKQPEEKLFIISDALNSGLVNGYNEQGYSADKLIEESQLYLLDRPDGERLYAQRYGLSRDPEEWFSSQSSLERPAETSAVDPDNYRVTINAHEGYNVYATNGVHYVLAKADDTFENIGRKFRISPRNLRRFNDLKDKKAQPLPGETVYIERKKKRWEGNAQHHICRDGERAASGSSKMDIFVPRASMVAISMRLSSPPERLAFTSRLT